MATRVLEAHFALDKDEAALAQQRLDELFAKAESSLNALEELEMKVLAAAIDAWEKAAFRELTKGLTAPEAVRERMEDLELDRSVLIDLLGSNSRVSEFLSGKRPALPKTQAVKVAKRLGLPLELLLLGKSQAERA